MKYKIAALFCVMLSYGNMFGLDDYTSQTYMFVRPVWDSIAINQASWNNLAYNKQMNGAAFQIYPIVSTSISNENSSKYFLFDYKKELTVIAGSANTFTTTGAPVPTNLSQGGYAVPSFNRDILGQWIGMTNTEGKSFSLNPQERQASVMLEYNQNLGAFHDSNFFKNWSLSFAAPITWIENNIGFSGDSAIAEAFSKKQYQFTRITPCNQTSIAFTQLQIALNTQYLNDHDTRIISSTGIIIPFVGLNPNFNLFEPVQGFNTHFVLNASALIQFPIYQRTPDSNSTVLFFFDFNNNFLSRNHQMRTFDLNNKSYSRYMKLLDRYTNTLIPAMNALTLRCRVEPFNVINFASGFRFKFKECIGSIGYEFWEHGDEVITPNPKQPEYGYDALHDDQVGVWHNDRYGIAFIGTDGELAKIDGGGNVVPLPVGEPGQTASQSTINFVASPDGVLSCCGVTPTFTQQNVYLQLSDLDRFSCAARSTIIHKAFMTVGLGEKGEKRDYFVNLGLSIELVQNNAALGAWTGWLKAGLTF